MTAEASRRLGHLYRRYLQLAVGAPSGHRNASGRLPGHPPTGRSVSTQEFAVYRLDAEKIVEVWVSADNLHVLNQLRQGERGGGMGLYRDQVVPRLINAALGPRTTEELRRRVCEGLRGDVVEIGFGSGLNVPYYPDTVDRVDAVEPADVGWKLAAERLAETRIPVRRSGLDGASLPFPDETFDAALSTWTVCTIPDIATALSEVRRVLKPDGVLHFVEHGLAPDERVRQWQRRLDPVQRRVAGGCHLTRPVSGLLTAAGFEITELDVFYEPGAAKFLGALSLGTAVSS